MKQITIKSNKIPIVETEDKSLKEKFEKTVAENDKLKAAVTILKKNIAVVEEATRAEVLNKISIDLHKYNYSVAASINAKNKQTCEKIAESNSKLVEVTKNAMLKLFKHDLKRFGITEGSFSKHTIKGKMSSLDGSGANGYTGESSVDDEKVVHEFLENKEEIIKKLSEIGYKGLSIMLKHVSDEDVTPVFVNSVNEVLTSKIVEDEDETEDVGSESIKALIDMINNPEFNALKEYIKGLNPDSLTDLEKDDIKAIETLLPVIEEYESVKANAGVKVKVLEDKIAKLTKELEDEKAKVEKDKEELVDTIDKVVEETIKKSLGKSALKRYKRYISRVANGEYDELDEENFTYEQISEDKFIKIDKTGVAHKCSVKELSIIKRILEEESEDKIDVDSIKSLDDAIAIIKELSSTVEALETEVKEAVDSINNGEGVEGDEMPEDGESFDGQDENVDFNADDVETEGESNGETEGESDEANLDDIIDDNDDVTAFDTNELDNVPDLTDEDKSNIYESIIESKIVSAIQLKNIIKSRQFINKNVRGL